MKNCHGIAIDYILLKKVGRLGKKNGDDICERIFDDPVIPHPWWHKV